MGVAEAGLGFSRLPDRKTASTGDAQAGKGAAALRIAMVTNIPAPYRVPVLNRIAATEGVTFKAFYAAEREPDRQWDLPHFAHDHEFLRGRMHTRNGRYIHDNPVVYDRLKAYGPDVVVTTGYNPTHLYALAYALVHRRHHVAMTDGTATSEAGLSRLHQTVRRFVLTRSSAFIAASEGGRRLFQAYGVDDRKIHFSPLCANSDVDWAGATPMQPPVDLLFSGRLVPVKNCGFFLDVAARVAALIGRRVRVAILGSGPLEAALRAQAASLAERVEAHFAGHVAQTELPRWFCGARLFLFPTSWDPWGVVANEACMAGVPVIVTPHAGVAGDLVRDGENGHVLPLDLDSWARAAAGLLTSHETWRRMSAAARTAVEPFNFDRAAQGIVDAARQSREPRVVCVQRRLTHYRVPLFERIRERLAGEGVRFELVVGDPMPQEKQKSDSGTIAWAAHVPCRYLLGGLLCWQNCGRAAKGADMLLLTQENKLLYNYIAAWWRRPKRLAYWGHGRNFQGRRGRVWPEMIRRRLAIGADWWFAYTGASVKAVAGFGFADSKITNLENASDTANLVELCDSVTNADIAAFRARWGLGSGPVGVFMGSLYAEKRIDFLIEAARRVIAEVPDFRLFIVGDGPERAKVEAAARTNEWLRYGGFKEGMRKAICLRAGSIMTNPGLVGLNILDAFAAGLPIATTDCGIHSPEIDYLENGQNGLMTPNTLEAYTDALVRLLRDGHEHARLARGARLAAAHYTLDNMVDRFCEGIHQALARPPR